jgi:4-cresol dehydrogenase (hydroxylating)
MAIPPGVSERDFNRALRDFREIVGEKWVFTSPEAIALYRDSYSPFYDDEGERLTSAAIAPDTTEQVQAIMRVCNQYRIPIYPISTGKNLGYGGSAPAYSGSMVLDLKRMNRILNVDERNHTLLVEPGVTFWEIDEYFRENNIDITLDIPDPAWGSLVGHALDRGFGHTYSDYGRDRFSTVCGMEIVLANGELIRTATGALETSTMWQDNKWGVGPGIDAMFSQSNFGVITKMGLWVRPGHRGYRAGRIHVAKYEDLIPLIDVECELSNAGINNGMTAFGSDLAPFGPPDPAVVQLVNRPGGPDVPALEALASDRGIGVWHAELKFHGPLSVSAAQWEYCKELYREKLPSAWFEDWGPPLEWPLSEEEISQLNTPGHAEKVHIGMPSMSRFRGGNRTQSSSPDWGHLWFAPLIPKRGEEVFKAQEVFGAEFRKANSQGGGIQGGPLGYFGRAPLHWQSRVGVFLNGLSVSRDRQENRRTRELFLNLVQVAADNGWQEYRTPAFFQTEVMDMTTGFNDHALMKFYETLKDAIDPNGIISAGRYGIWPEHLRREKAPWHRRNA